MSAHRKYIRFIPSKSAGARAHDGRFKASIIRTSDGQTVRSKTLPTKTEANTWAQHYLADLARGIDRGADDTVDAQLTLGGLIDAYNTNAGLRIVAQESRQVDWWKQALGNKPLLHITAKDIRRKLDEYLASPCQVYNRASGELQDTKRARSPAARNRQLAALKAVYKWGLELEEPLVSENTPAIVKNLPEDNKRKQFLNKEQVIEMLGYARKSEWPRCYLFLLGLIHTGARKNEWLQMEWQRIDLDTATAFVPGSDTKNGDDKLMALTPDIIAELRRLRASEPAIGGLVFPSTRNPSKPFNHRRSWKTILKKLGMDHPMGHPQYVRLHDLRHSAAALLANSGATLPQIGKILGHKSMASTDRYLHLCIEGKQRVTNAAMSGLSLEANI